MGLFTDDDVWNGGFYELALEYRRGVVPSVRDGLRAIWRSNLVAGCYLEFDRNPQDQQRAEFDASMRLEGHLYGVATLPGDRSVACGTCCVREDGGADWLVFYCPVGGLGRVYPVRAFPFDDDDHESWRGEVDAWLTELGRDIFDIAPFRLGLVGFETSGELYADEVFETGVPAKRTFGILLPTENGLVVHPRT